MLPWEEIEMLNLKMTTPCFLKFFNDSEINRLMTLDHFEDHMMKNMVIKIFKISKNF